MIKIVLFLSVFMFLVGCSTSSATPALKPVVKQVPKWVNSVLPDDDSISMYGLGLANNREAAVKAALSNVIARLGTTIESSYESIQKVDGAYSNLKVESKIKADVSKVKVNNYKVIKSYKLSYREFAVMIAIDKQKFINGLKNELEVKKKNISDKLSSTKSMNTINRYNTKKELANQAKKLLPVIYILAELDPRFTKNEYLTFVSKINMYFLDEAKKLKFFVSGNVKSSKFVDILKNHLAQNGLRVVSSNKNAIKIQLNIEDNINKGYIKIAVLSLNIAVYEKSKRLGGEEIILKERYNNSIQGVYKNAAIHFKQDIQNKGLNKLIGIELNLE